MASALYGGSFDPIHLGHLAVIETAAESFDLVHVVVLANPQKSTGMFERSERARLVSASTAHLANVRVHEYHGLTVGAAAELRADVLLRSVHKEGRHEQSMAATNEVLTGIQTSFLMPDPRTAWISSSMVRELVAAGRIDDLADMVPPPVHAALRSRGAVS